MSANYTQDKAAAGPELPYRVPAARPSRLNPKSWTWKTWTGIAVALILIIVAAAVGGVLGARANAYPDYSKLNYSLQDTYSGDNFFSQFNYFTGYDPTHGFVHYVDSPTAVSENLTLMSNTTTSSATSLSTSGTAILRVDTADQNATTGRRSVRITSKKAYNTGLFIFDIVHSPYGCATWPSVWMTDVSNWPLNGEIDVVEAVNMGNMGNQVTLHTTKGCEIGKNRKRKQTGTALNYNCYNGTDSNAGCGVSGPTNTFGAAYNALGGGVYALELRSAGIRVWSFPRSNIPSDITSKSPDPSTWGTALADFPNLECDISSHFKNQTIVVDIDLCGDWAGQPSVFNADAQCTGTCSDWVADKASSFDQAYWEFGGFWTYTATAA
ncbi:glycoside hydrolase family 16 protein [Pleomassaria siparia CBS 279.74]|uniref:endo-1,3(4)-beta-glucanase n=1 Tax=Pleomassaria siparia CBS 279.74 TaxID=1314801 RepID=A0A6G1KLY1_9PLEO|nr:glycoside hydrolase family 16 protein [Pleomassaria siparia CBS 279.74]